MLKVIAKNYIDLNHQDEISSFCREPAESTRREKGGSDGVWGSSRTDDNDRGMEKPRGLGRPTAALEPYRAAAEQAHDAGGLYESI